MNADRVDHIKKYFRVIKKYGLITGMKISYAWRKSWLPDAVKGEMHMINIHNSPFYYRNATQDFDVFYEIFVYSEERKDGKGLYDIAYNFNPELVLDLGANIGVFTKYIKELFPEASVIAVEVENDNFAILQQNTKHISDVILYQRGIWYNNSNLKVIERATGTVGYKVEETTEATSIIGISIDELIKDYIGEKILIKMDIEGAERALFDHIENADWPNRINGLLIETHDKIIPGTDAVVLKTMLDYNFKYEKTSDGYYFYK